MWRPRAGWAQDAVTPVLLPARVSAGGLGEGPLRGWGEASSRGVCVCESKGLQRSDQSKGVGVCVCVCVCVCVREIPRGVDGPTSQKELGCVGVRE